jgi:hypothetical protein
MREGEDPSSSALVVSQSVLVLKRCAVIIVPEANTAGLVHQFRGCTPDLRLSWLSRMSLAKNFCSG